MFVGGLHKDTTVNDLYFYFQKFGSIDQVLIKYDQATKVPRGFGFILFEEKESLDRVIEYQGHHILLDKVIDPKKAQPHNTLPSYQHKLFLGGVSSDKGHTVENLVKYWVRKMGFRKLDRQRKFGRFLNHFPDPVSEFQQIR